jgi:Na+/melibiose symporter-like transporter
MTTVTSATSTLPDQKIDERPPSALKLTWSKKALYGSGDVVNAIKTTLFALFTLYFYTAVMGLSGTLVGIVSAIGLMWDALIDPYIGYISDRAQTAYGRRHPFMLAGALTMGASLWAFLSPPQDLSTALLFLWMLISSLLVRTSTSVYLVPYFALGAELSADYHERTSISAFRSILALVGTLLTASLSFLVFFPERTPGVDPKLAYAGYPSMGLTFGLIMTVIGLTTTLGTFSLVPHLPGREAGLPVQPRPNFLAGFIDALRNPSFAAIFVSFSLFFWGVVINSTLSIHYLTYYAKITSSSALSSFQAVFYLGGSLGILCWMAVARHVEKKLLYILSAVITAAFLLGAYLLIGEGRILGTGNVPALFVGHALAGVFGSIFWFIPWSMVADTIDEDELVTGYRREGSLTGIFFFGHQLASGLSVLFGGMLLDWYAGLVPGQAEQSALTSERIGILYGVLPAALILCAALVALRYKLSRSRMAEIQRELGQRRRKQAAQGELVL